MSDVSDRVPAVVVRAAEGETVPAAGVDHVFKLLRELRSRHHTDTL